MNVALASQSEPLPEASKQVEAQGQSALLLLQQGDESSLLAHLSRLERAAEQEADAAALALVRAARQACRVRLQQALIVQEREAAHETAVSQLHQLDEQLAALLTGLGELLPAAMMAEKERGLPSLLKSVSGWLRPSKPKKTPLTPKMASEQPAPESVVETAVVPPPHNPHVPTLTIYMLGSFRMYVNEQLVTDWVGNKSRSIFKYLVARHPAPVPRELLMEAFWPAEREEVARRNLYQAIYLIRQALSAAEDGFKFLLSDEGSYRLNPELNLWIDYVTFEQHRQAGLARLATHHVAEAQHQLELASELYEGDFLNDELYEDWPLVQREQLKQQYIELLDQLAVLHFEAERYAACNAVCRQILHVDGCREDSHRRLMRSYAALGQRHLALRQYHRCVATLAEELDVLPEPATERLYQSLTS